MKTWETLREKLIEVTGYTRVYYQPPSKMEYPCIRFELTDRDIKYANEKRYASKIRYTIMVIGKSPDNDQVIDAILQLPYCSFDRRYIADNLYHDILTIYW